MVEDAPNVLFAGFVRIFYDISYQAAGHGVIEGHAVTWSKHPTHALTLVSMHFSDIE